MTVTWHGTASIELESQGQSIFFDPFVPLEGSSTRTGREDYRNARDIFITHGHVDHIGSLTELAEDGVCIRCTKTPMNTLLNKGVAPEYLSLLKPGDEILCGAFTVKVFQSRHISFDAKIVLSTLFSPRFFRMFSQAKAIGKENRICKENGETVGYLVSAEGKNMFILGSLALDSDTVYPQNADVLVLPYQGSSRLSEPAKRIIEKLQPKAVFLDHFDDTFPPISRNIDTEDIENYLNAAGIPVVKPCAHVPYNY